MSGHAKPDRGTASCAVQRHPWRVRSQASLVAILLASGGLLVWGSAYLHNIFQGQLAAQQTFFPAKGSSALAGRVTKPATVIPHAGQAPAKAA
jgi:hypothetical protein